MYCNKCRCDITKFRLDTARGKLCPNCFLDYSELPGTLYKNGKKVKRIR